MDNSFFGKGNARIWIGLALLLIGGLLFADRFGWDLPNWMFRWPMFLIIVGIFQGFATGFRIGPWIVVILFGGIFLYDMIFPGFNVWRYFWPIVIITIGLLLLLRPGGPPFMGKPWDRPEQTTPEHLPAQSTTPIDSVRPANSSPNDYINSVAIFGGIRKIVYSKDFRGGDVVSVCGGNELDLTKSDIHGTVVLELTQVMGGTKLIVPSHWNIRSEVSSFLGGIEDKRVVDPNLLAADKTLVLRGSSVMGGIEIKSY